MPVTRVERRARRVFGAVLHVYPARRFNTWLLGAFGAAAMTLTAIGLYSLLAYVVALRRHEMAVRLAIGGTPSHMVGLVVRGRSHGRPV